MVRKGLSGEWFYNIEIIKGQQQKHGLVFISYLQVNQAPLFSFSAAVHEVFTMEGLYTSVHTTLFYYGTESITEKKIIDLLQIQLQPVEHRLQPGWELHCHHYRHHRYHPRRSTQHAMMVFGILQ